MVEIYWIMLVFAANIIIKQIQCYFFYWNCSLFIYI